MGSFIKNKLSIIIPCYNSQETVAETIGCFYREFEKDNFAGADFNYEIIIVDDGSTDNTVSEIERIRDDHIILRIKENSGVSDSRNYGLRHATGEYVWFFDSDDLLFENVGKKIYDYLNLSPDIIKFSSVTVDCQTKKNIELFNNSNYSEIIFNGKYRDFLNHNTTGFSCWGVIIKRELLIKQDILFDTELSIGEDVLWNISIAKKCGYAEALISNLNVVKYIVNTNSIVNSVNPIANYRYYRNSLRLYNNLLSVQPAEEFLSQTLQHFKGTTINQIISKFLSCKMSINDVKKEIVTIDNIICYANSNNRYSKVFKMLAKNVLLMYFSQMLYRCVFLRYVKPYIARN